ncbi:hypothetical protein C8J56DRAFT_860543 [Mycena floridula]|nr:hypothetical protein C8J56DRAFT_860543 [Mycena floridula]
MLSAKFILAAFSTFVAVSAAPGAEALGIRSEQSFSTITVCVDSISPPQGCVNILINSEVCINLTGAFNFLNKEISSAKVPAGFTCTLFEDFFCHNGGVIHHDVAVLTGGTWNLTNVQGIAGTQNFNDLTTSLSCSFIIT